MELSSKPKNGTSQRPVNLSPGVIRRSHSGLTRTQFWKTFLPYLENYEAVQRTLTYFVRGSITVQPTSCLTGLDWAALFMFNLQHIYSFGQIRTSQTGVFSGGSITVQLLTSCLTGSDSAKQSGGQPTVILPLELVFSWRWFWWSPNLSGSKQNQVDNQFRNLKNGSCETSPYKVVTE